MRKERVQKGWSECGSEVDDKGWLGIQQVDHKAFQAEEAGWAFGTFREQQNIQIWLGSRTVRGKELGWGRTRKINKGNILGPWMWELTFYSHSWETERYESCLWQHQFCALGSWYIGNTRMSVRLLPPFWRVLPSLQNYMAVEIKTPIQKGFSEIDLKNFVTI